MTGALFLALLAATAWAQDKGALQCPASQVAVRDPRTGEWACKARLKRTRDVFGDEKKASDDPCPDGYWWHKTQVACAPIRCTEDPNAAKVGDPCPRGHHAHLASGGDWTRPLICVEDYVPGHEGTGGRNPRKGGCDLCLQNEPNHRPGGNRDAWRFERPEDAEAKKRRLATPAPIEPDATTVRPTERRLDPRALKRRGPEPQPPSNRNVMPVCPKGQWLLVGYKTRRCEPCTPAIPSCKAREELERAAALMAATTAQAVAPSPTPAAAAPPTPSPTPSQAADRMVAPLLR